MHKRTKSEKIIKKNQEPMAPVSSGTFRFPDIAFIKTDITSRSIYTSHRAPGWRAKFSISPIKNFDFIMGKCEKELRKIRTISMKIKKSARKLQHNQKLINRIISKPLYSIHELGKDKPKFLTKNLKYQ